MVKIKRRSQTRLRLSGVDESSLAEKGAADEARQQQNDHFV